MNPIIHGGKVIKHCRKQARKTQMEAAKKYGVSAYAVGKWERGDCKVFWDDAFGICGSLGFSHFQTMQITLDLMKAEK